MIKERTTMEVGDVLSWKGCHYKVVSISPCSATIKALDPEKLAKGFPRSLVLDISTQSTGFRKLKRRVKK